MLRVSRDMGGQRSICDVQWYEEKVSFLQKGCEWVGVGGEGHKEKNFVVQTVWQDGGGGSRNSKNSVTYYLNAA